MSCRGGIQKKMNKINEQSIQHSKIAQFIMQNIVQLNTSNQFEYVFRKKIAAKNCEKEAYEFSKKPPDDTEYTYFWILYSRCLFSLLRF